jgi:drug/metabolite transporter (DMT)-like permease
MDLRDAAQLFLLAALWGGSFLFMRIAAPVLGAIWLIEIRVLLAGLVLLPIAAHYGLIPELRKHWRSLFLIGCINLALPFSLLAFSAIVLPSGFTSILNATVPLFGTIVATLWLKEKMTIARLVGFQLGFVGVMVLVGWRTFAVTPDFVKAVMTGLMAAILYAIAAVYIKKYFVGVPALVVATGSQIGAVVCLLPLLPFTVPQQMPSPLVISCVLALALLSTVWASLIYLQLIQNVGPTKTMTVAYLIPGFAIVWGAIVLREPVTPSMLVGGGLILLGTAISNELLRLPFGFSKQ